MERNMEEIIFGIIAGSGDARSDLMASIKEARSGEFDQARAHLREGREKLLAVHNIHTEIIQKEAAGERVPVTMLLNHAQDHLMATMLVDDLAEDIILLNERMDRLERWGQWGRTDQSERMDRPEQAGKLDQTRRTDRLEEKEAGL